MVLIPVLCPHCHSDQVIKGGKTKAGQQRFKCQNTACPCYSFQRDLLYKGRAPTIKEQIVDMTLNGSGIRDTARVLKISPTTVMNTLKKKSLYSPR
jgi:transposase-like protein